MCLDIQLPQCTHELQPRSASSNLQRSIKRTPVIVLGFEHEIIATEARILLLKVNFLVPTELLSPGEGLHLQCQWLCYRLWWGLRIHFLSTQQKFQADKKFLLMKKSIFINSKRRAEDQNTSLGAWSVLKQLFELSEDFKFHKAELNEVHDSMQRQITVTLNEQRGDTWCVETPETVTGRGKNTVSSSAFLAIK